MKKFVKIFFTAVLFFSVSPLLAQNLTGIWRGYFITGDGDEYRYEVQLDQSKKASISGVTYSYLDTRFYGKATFTGNYTKASNAALVKEIKTIEVKMAGSSVACIMKCRLVYSRSGKEEFLEGLYTSTYEKTDPLYGVKRGGNCGGGKVFLRKVTTSDFYVEPFLRNKKINTEDPRKDSTKINIAKKPAAKKPTNNQATAKTPQPTKPNVVKKPTETTATVQPQIKTPETSIVAKPVEPKIIPTPITIRDRKNELTKIIQVSSNEIQISLYDNGEIDDDTVSIYLDGALLLANKRLSAKPITYSLHVDETSPEHTLVMVAENLGRIPPNTSLMIIQDGDKRYQISITSNTQKNAMVRFRYGKNE